MTFSRGFSADTSSNQRGDVARWLPRRVAGERVSLRMASLSDLFDNFTINYAFVQYTIYNIESL